MTDDPADKAGTEGERRLLAQSESVLEELLNGLRDASERLASEKGLSRTALAEAQLGFSAARLMFLEEVRRHEDRLRDTDGGGDAAALDLDAVRARIGRRLDRIRDARGAG